MNISRDSMQDLYYTINYAGRAAFAAVIAGSIGLAQKDRASITLAQQTIEDAYCAAACAARAMNSDAMTVIYFCRIDAQRLKDAAIALTAQALETALDVDPAILAQFEAAYQSLLRDEAAFSTIATYMNEYAEMLDYEGVDAEQAREMFIEEYEQTPPVMPDAQMIEAAWDAFIGRYPNAYHVPNTLAHMVDAATDEHDDRDVLLGLFDFSLSPESIAYRIALKLAAERGPKDACRYCDESFNKRAESIHKGVCHWCDKDHVTDVLLSTGVNVLAYNPLTGELVTADESDADSLN
jgi:hypothetical protein